MPRRRPPPSGRPGRWDSEPHSVFTYLANTLKSGEREVPYSLITAIDADAMASLGPVTDGPTGDRLERLDRARSRRAHRRSADARLRGVGTARTARSAHGRLSNRRRGADAGRRRGSHPRAGVSWPDRLGVDGGLGSALPDRPASRPPVDEDYWKKFRTTPKAFIRFDVGQRLWRSRYGDRTSIRVTPPADQSLTEVRDRYAARLRGLIDPLAAGLSVQDVRTDGLAASRGSTDFGEYFTYFSFFLVLSALLLAALFFRLGIEQRAREVGLLRAVGYTTGRIRALFAAEGFVVTLAGSVIGIGGAIAYAWVMMTGLGSWWSGAVGTDALRLHVSTISLAGGVIGVAVTAMACLWWTLRSLSRVSERSLLSGMLASDTPLVAGGRRSRLTVTSAVVFGALGFALIVAGAESLIDKTGAFFGASTALLAACLCGVSIALRRPVQAPVQTSTWSAMWRLGIRHAADRPGRSVLAIAVIAAATFILISVDAFRREGPPAGDRRSGVGGYSLAGRSAAPAGPRSQRPRRPRRAGTGRVGRRASRAVPGAAGRRRELSEPVRAEEPDDTRCHARLHRVRPVHLSRCGSR